MTTDGWLADHILLHENAIVHLPAYMSYVEAASLPCAAVTAWTALNLVSPLQPGQTVLVQGTGGVALFALQVARMFGARVLAITSTDEKAEKLKGLGAESVVNYRTFPDWDREILALTDGRGVDKVVDIAGDKTIVKSAAATRKGGDITIVGFVSGFGGGLPPSTSSHDPSPSPARRSVPGRTSRPCSPRWPCTRSGRSSIRCFPLRSTARRTGGSRAATMSARSSSTWRTEPSVASKIWAGSSRPRRPVWVDGSNYGRAAGKCVDGSL
ncbi:zinc-binding dehydrogenase [Microvirga aerilata]